MTSSPRPIALVVGTRPEVIKLAPVYRALLHHPEVGIPRGVATGQSPALLAQHREGIPLAETLSLPPSANGRAPDALGDLLAPLLRGLTESWRTTRPGVVVVQGDTVSALAGTLVAEAEGIPVVHVEAGLRSGVLDRPYPEEIIRRMIAAVAGLHCAPTPRAVRALEAEQVRGRIVLTGNPVVDALAFDGEGIAARFRPPVPNTVLVTCHRREGWGTILPALVTALETLTADPAIRVVWPLHPNPHVHAALAPLHSSRRVAVVPPYSRRAFLEALARVAVVVTDSGGVVEEAVTWGIPTVIIRDETERPEALDCGVGVLCPAEALAESLPVLVRQRLARSPERTPQTCFGDGRAGERIVAALAAWLADRAFVSSPPVVKEEGIR